MKNNYIILNKKVTEKSGTFVNLCNVWLNRGQLNSHSTSIFSQL